MTLRTRGNSRMLRIVHTAPELIDQFKEPFTSVLMQRLGLNIPYELQPGDDTHGLEESCGIISLGSPLMLNTPETSWAPQLARDLETAANVGVPVLAICFSHQMMAQHFGGTLGRWDAIKEGIKTVTFANEGPFEGVGTASVILTHTDRVTSLGPGTTSLGEGGFGGIQAFKHDRLPIWGIQAHPEGDDQVLRAIEDMGMSDNFRGYDKAQRDDPTGRQILRNFAHIIRTQSVNKP